MIDQTWVRSEKLNISDRDDFRFQRQNMRCGEMRETGKITTLILIRYRVYGLTTSRISVGILGEYLNDIDISDMIQNFQ